MSVLDTQRGVGGRRNMGEGIEKSDFVSQIFAFTVSRARQRIPERRGDSRKRNRRPNERYMAQVEDKSAISRLSVDSSRIIAFS